MLHIPSAALINQDENTLPKHVYTSEENKSNEVKKYRYMFECFICRCI